MSVDAPQTDSTIAPGCPTILLLCDQAGAAPLALEKLSHEGFTIRTAPNVFRAVALFANPGASGAPAVVVVDIDPRGGGGGGGGGIFREINRDVLILALFSPPHRAKLSTALQLGADACLPQPFYPTEIISLIRQWGRRRGAESDDQRHLASLARLAKGAAHEINNPLTTLSGWLQMMEADERRDPKERQRLSSMREEADRIAKVVERLIAFSRESPPERAPVDIGVIVSELLNDLRKQAVGVQVQSNLEAVGAKILGDGRLIRQACRMLLDDAAAALNGNGKITVRTRIPEPGFVEISIWDNGRRIPAEELPRAFEPYGASSRAGENMSLAYPAAYGIVRSHGGRLTLRSDQEKGTEFLVRLPLM